MRSGISVRGVGHATSIFLALSFVLCVVGDLIFPAYDMHPMWERLLPGFTWIGGRSFVIGLAEGYAWGWYIALIWVPLYNVFTVRERQAASTPGMKKAA